MTADARQSSPSAGSAMLRGSNTESPYTFERQIGKGSFATVFKGRSKKNMSVVAIKVVQQNRLQHDKRLMGIFESEMAILTSLKHPNIVGLLDVFHTETDFNLVMEYCIYGDLSGFIKDRHSLIRTYPELSRLFAEFHTLHNGLHETIVRHLLCQLASAVSFLRSNNIVHRDIKPQNLLLTPGDSSSSLGSKTACSDLPNLKLADFGFARFLPAASMAETLCGSPLYMAPEILRYEKYNAAADLWSFGAVAFESCTGRPPFPAANHLDLLRKIEQADDKVVFPVYSANLSPEIKDLICGLLKQKPSERMPFDELSKHPSLLLPLGNSNVASGYQQPPLDSPHTPSSDSASNNKGEITLKMGDTIEELSARPGTAPLPSETEWTNAEKSPPLDHNTQHEQTSLVSEGISETMSSTDYVFIEKRTVEVNAMADELSQTSIGQVSQSQRHSSRRLSSISYGFSPTNALASALSRSSARLFGVKTIADADFPSNGTDPIPGKRTGYTDTCSRRISTSSEMQALGSIENFTVMAKAVATLADSTVGRIASADQAKQLELTQEALVLYLKSLNFYAAAMKVASSWWDRSRSTEDQLISPRLSMQVEYVRESFNSAVLQAEHLQKKLKILGESHQSDIDVSADRLLFDRALELMRTAAVQELSPDKISQSEFNYSSALWILKAILERENAEGQLPDNDRQLVERLNRKVSLRLLNLKRRTEITNASNRHNSRSPSQYSPSRLPL